MFKLESYITPIILSYVDKYIKNFKLEDSQVSLWGGDASFHNLELRLEVLEQELQSPFSFVSGQIQQLSIHVPWTKLTSEPITITINTIECVLKLRGANSPTNEATPIQPKPSFKKPKHELEAPPNYIQFLINKIVSNIKIICNNLILKYVEEDIVLSMNVKYLNFESANAKWEPAYTDISPTEVTLRKIIGLNDLTICLDKRNAAGKIDNYLEPMLYRCSMTMHLLKNYHSAIANKASITRLDIYCNNLEFSMTEQQVPMLLRLCLLLYALQQKQLRPDGDAHSDPTNNLAEAAGVGGEQSDSWSGWAWSMFSYIWPYQWDLQCDDQLFIQMGHTVHIGLYIDLLSFTFKVSEKNNDKGFYNQKKTHYMSLLQLKLQGIYCEILKTGAKWFNCLFGISEMILLPIGNCSCGYNDIKDNLIFLKIGTIGNNHKTDSLFDVEAIENKGKCRNYNTNWDYHMETTTESVLLDRTSAIAFDYVYQLDIPNDASSDILSEIGSNLELSNLPEKACIRFCVGPIKILFCSSLWHRISTLKMAASAYDYAPYGNEKPDIPLQDLLPPSTDDFDSLNQFIPTRTVRITFFAPNLQLCMPDHNFFMPTKTNLCLKPKKVQSESSNSNLGLPKISIKCQLVDINIINPMYVNRLIHTTCQLPKPPKEMFNACFTTIDIKVMGISSRLILNSNCHTNIIVPFNCSFNIKKILLPKYWIDPDITHVEYTFETENFTLIGTKAKLLMVAQILEKIIKIDYPDLCRARKTTLLMDAIKDFGIPYLELYLENIRYKNVTTISTVSIDTSLGSIKAFVLESEQKASTNDLRQVMFFSGPEPKKNEEKLKDVSPLLSVTLQYPLDPEQQIHPTILIFNLQDIKICIDPLFCKWLFYCPMDLGIDIEFFERSNSKTKLYSETSGSALETSTKRINPQIESVHSSSDRDLLQIPQIIKFPKGEDLDIQDKIYNTFKTWHLVWKCMLFYGNMSECTIYFPMHSLSALGMRGIGEAVEQAIKNESLEMMVLHLPSVTIHSSQKQNISKYLKLLPIKLPPTIWSLDKTSFPWTMSTTEINCYTIKNNKKEDFLKPVTLSATVALSTKTFPPPNKNDTKSKSIDGVDCLGICVYIDMTPVLILASEPQLYILASIMYSLAEGITNFFCEKKELIDTIDVLPTISGGSTSLSPTIIKENTPESLSDDKSLLTDTTPIMDQIKKNDNVKVTAWIQLTITRFTIDLLAGPCDNKQLKLIIDIEDIVNSLDFQNVYLKFKSKIGSITIKHLELINNIWKCGKFGGFVLKQRDDINVIKKDGRHDDNGLINITLTRASCQHTHSLWGTIEKRNKSIKILDLSKSRYITEIVISIEPIDLILSLDLLKNFSLLLVPPHGINNDNNNDNKIGNVSKIYKYLNNQILPLAYLDCQEIRIIIPSNVTNINQDVYIMEINKISLNSTAINPICRKPIRLDIYQQAAKARILNIPGSEVEDRQYQFDIFGISLETGKWHDLELILTGKNDWGINSNPALQWNNLKHGQHSIDPILNLKKIIDKFEITIVLAPAIIYNDTIVCGTSLELNFVSDLMINLSLDQVKLGSALINEYIEFNSCLTSKTEYIKIKYPYSRFQNPNDSLIDGADIADSGIDSSDLKSVQSNKSKIKSCFGNTSTEPMGKFPGFPHYNYGVPVEFLFTAGKISLILYQITTKGANVKSKKKDKKKKKPSLEEIENKNYEASEEESSDYDNENNGNFIPLLYVSLLQPNIYYTIKQMSKKLQISCFNILAKISNNFNSIKTQPIENDFSINLIETKCGTPHPDNGVLPSFLTIKYIEDFGKLPNFLIDLTKPIKFCFSSLNYRQCLKIINKIMENLIKITLKGITLKEENNFNYMEFLNQINTLTLKINQIVFVIKSDYGSEANIILEDLTNNLSLHNTNKIHNFIKFQSISLSINTVNQKKLILNPWTVSLDIILLWESWQTCDDIPQIQVVIDSDCIFIDINPQQIKFAEELLKELSELINFDIINKEEKPINKEEEEEEKEESTSTIWDLHYKDDLRAGAFQFVDSIGDADDLPLPYQVIFYNDNISAMVWRYPQPRILTKVRVFPVPYKTSNNDNYQILCNLEYWCECQRKFIYYTKFYLSENQITHLNLPKNEPQKAVACIWRVIMSIDDNNNKNRKIELSSRALATCLRIDSYFNKSIVPKTTVMINCNDIKLNLSTTFLNKESALIPKALRQYTPDYQLIPDYQCFLSFSLAKLEIYIAKWLDKSSVELNGSFKSSILDYAYLTKQPFIKRFLFKLELNFSDKNSINFSSNHIEIMFGPNIAHTLAVSGQLWLAQSLNNNEATVVMLTRYVICNNTNTTIMIGQDGTNECLPIKSRCFHMYAWKSQKANRKLKLAIEDVNLIWTKPFFIDDDDMKILKLKFYNYIVVVTVTSLSTTQKQVTITGQLIISNMLKEYFYLKIVEDVAAENKDAAFSNASSHILPGKTVAPSIFIHCKKKYFLRLRFYGLESAWTGDIPLMEHRTGAQPWLVKVPLQEKGQFLSIWCRIVVEEKDGFNKYLAMLWPLFTVRSNLPVPLKIHINTPSLNVNGNVTISGKGKLEQLYCPGTVDHSHLLTFELNNEISSSKPYIPLNYSVVDSNFFFKKKEEIDVILKALDSYNESNWPYFEDGLNDIDWITDEQPLTTIQVRYQNACPYSSALVVELSPWCLMVNTLGCPITLRVNGTELCRIPQHGIVAPPKLDETFNLGFNSGNIWYYSNPLQLAKSDWSQTFYMPTISGTLPLEGSITTIVHCDVKICLISISSSFVNEMRLLKVSSSYVLSNHVAAQIEVLCLATELNDEQELFDNVPLGYSFTLAPKLDKNCTGIPLIQWYGVNTPLDPNEEYALYVVFSINPNLGWSCPIRVDETFTRKSFSVITETSSVPLVLISQEYKGQNFLSLHYDPCPQIYIENHCGFNLYCAQLSIDKEIVEENKHIKWYNKIDVGRGVFYTMPTISSTFPEIQDGVSENIVFSCDTKDDLNWSLPLNITSDLEQFLRIPFCGDVKIIVKNTAYTTLITVESVSQVEISAKDIRVRLSMQDLEVYSDVQNFIFEDNAQKNIKKQQNPSIYEKMFIQTLSKEKNVDFYAFIDSFSILFISDVEEGEFYDVANFTCNYIGLKAVQSEVLNATFYISDIQLDNQLYSRDSFDFPVVFIRQEPKKLESINILSDTTKELFENYQNDPLLLTEMVIESWWDNFKNSQLTGIKSIKFTTHPLSCYIEDLFITSLKDYFSKINPTKVIIWNESKNCFINAKNSINVMVSEMVYWQSGLYAKPLNINYLNIETLSILLSVHCSIKMYIALDQSPLQFGKFERKRLLTTSYRLGHSLTMHYLSGAIFGAGWVVSSLELLGSPSGLARAMSSGIRDFISLPYRGLIEGPWAFLIGVTHGSASLMKHLTAGTLQSVTKLASSVARNLDRLTLDEEHLKRAEEQRRQRPQGLTEGLLQGLTGFGISLLGAIGGIAHHPIKSVMSDGASPISLATGVGLGLVGIVTKPLSGAAEFVALTGQGLLQGAGWNTLPIPRNDPILNNIKNCSNSYLKYMWKVLMPEMILLYVIEAVTDKFEEVSLILTKEALIIIDTNTDKISRILSLHEIELKLNDNDTTMITIKIKPKQKEIINKDDDDGGDDDDFILEMDPISRARVENYVKSTTTFLHIPDNNNEHSINNTTTTTTVIMDDLIDDNCELIMFYINPNIRNYFHTLFILAKQENQNYKFSVL